MIEVVDAVRDLFEPPDPTDETRSVNGVLIDRSAAQPIADTVADSIYAWESARRESSVGTGEVRQDFEVTVLYVMDRAGELGQGQSLRSVSEALDTKMSSYMKLVRLNTNIPPWASGTITATSDADFVRQFDVRGFAVRVSGYRLVTES